MAGLLDSCWVCMLWPTCPSVNEFAAAYGGISGFIHNILEKSGAILPPIDEIA
jgi:hypothetical protein